MSNSDDVESWSNFCLLFFFQESLQLSLSLIPPNALVGLVTYGRMVSEREEGYLYSMSL